MSSGQVQASTAALARTIVVSIESTDCRLELISSLPAAVMSIWTRELTRSVTIFPRTHLLQRAIRPRKLACVLPKKRATSIFVTAANREGLSAERWVDHRSQVDLRLC